MNVFTYIELTLLMSNSIKVNVKIWELNNFYFYHIKLLVTDKKISTIRKVVSLLNL